jgi:hypothetical protein
MVSGNDFVGLARMAIEMMAVQSTKLHRTCCIYSTSEVQLRLFVVHLEFAQFAPSPVSVRHVNDFICWAAWILAAANQQQTTCIAVLSTRCTTGYCEKVWLVLGTNISKAPARHRGLQFIPLPCFPLYLRRRLCNPNCCTAGPIPLDGQT